MHLPAHLAHLAPREAGDVAPVEEDLAGGRLRQLHDRPAERRLAAARLADDAERLAGSNSQVDPVDRVHLADLTLRAGRRESGSRQSARRGGSRRPPHAARGSPRPPSRSCTPSPTPAAVVRRRVRAAPRRSDIESGASPRRSSAGPGRRCGSARPAPGSSADGTRTRRHVEQARRLARDRAQPLVLGREPRQAPPQTDRVQVPGLAKIV